MVSLELKKEIRQKIGRGCVAKFQKWLADKGLKNRHGEFYSEGSVKQYLYFDRNPEEMDLEFLRFANFELEKIKKIQKKGKETLSKFKELAS